MTRKQEILLAALSYLYSNLDDANEALNLPEPIEEQEVTQLQAWVNAEPPDYEA